PPQDPAAAGRLGRDGAHGPPARERQPRRDGKPRTRPDLADAALEVGCPAGFERSALHQDADGQTRAPPHRAAETEHRTAEPLHTGASRDPVLDQRAVGETRHGALRRRSGRGRADGRHERQPAPDDGGAPAQRVAPAAGVIRRVVLAPRSTLRRRIASLAASRSARSLTLAATFSGRALPRRPAYAVTPAAIPAALIATATPAGRPSSRLVATWAMPNAPAATPRPFTT